MRDQLLLILLISIPLFLLSIFLTSSDLVTEEEAARYSGEPAPYETLCQNSCNYRNLTYSQAYSDGTCTCIWKNKEIRVY